MISNMFCFGTPTTRPVQDSRNPPTIIQTEINFSAATKYSSVKDLWLIDSGCSRHMTGDKNLFHQLRDLEDEIFVKFGDGKLLQASGVGQVATVIGQIDALYVPQLCANLLSVHQLNQSGASVCFRPTESQITYGGRRFKISMQDQIFVLGAEECCYLSATSVPENPLNLWHQKLGHLNYPATASFIQRFGISVPKSSSIFCRICAEAKLVEKKFKSRKDYATTPLYRLHSDLCGPFDRSHDGYLYFVTLVDEKSRFAVVDAIKTKSEASSKIQSAMSKLKNKTGLSIGILRSDGGGEYNSQSLQDFLRDNYIEHEIVPSYTPQLNGIAERLNRTLVERMKCLLTASGLNFSFWKEALDYSVYIYNRTPHSSIGFKTPIEVFTSTSMTELPEFHVFGSVAYYHVPKDLRSKLDNNASKGLFLGFSNTATVVLALPDLVLKEVRTVKVDEGRFLDEVTLKNLGIGKSLSFADVRSTIPQYEVDEFARFEGEQIVEDAAEILSFDEAEGDDGQNDEQVAFQHEDLEENPVEENFNERRSSRSTHRPGSYAEDEVEWHPSFGRRSLADQDDEIWEQSDDGEEEQDETAMLAELFNKLQECNLASAEDLLRPAREAQLLQVMMSRVTRNQPVQHSRSTLSEVAKTHEPRSYNEAKTDPEWRESMQKEFQSLLDNGTWELQELPPGRKVIKTKWVYKIKSDGRWKSRLVAKGFTQVAGIDFDETWSPVGRKSSLKLLISHVLRKGWTWKQMDVDTAFLNSRLDEEIYMEQPQGFQDGTNRVCRLRKAIYGLKQASRAWYTTLHVFLTAKGLKRSRVDPCLYYGDGMIIFVYVDDLVIAGKNDERVESISQEFKNHFRMKDLGKPRKLLGLDLIEVPRGVFLTGYGIISELLQRYQMYGSRYVSTPMDPNHVLLPRSDGQATAEEQSKYASILGSLLYIANSYRPDIAYAVSILSQFTSNPSDDHWRGIKRVLRYLNGTKYFGLFFPRFDSKPAVLKGFTDADFAACFTRRSRTGFAFFVGSCLISWSSRKQSVIALSTCEAEYYALTEGAKEAINLKRLVWEIQNQDAYPDELKLDPVTLFCDNQSTIFVSKNPAEHRMMKHVDLRYKWIQERVESGEFEVEYVPTKDQVADLFTKGLAKVQHEKLCSECGVFGDKTLQLEREC